MRGKILAIAVVTILLLQIFITIPAIAAAQEVPYGPYLDKVIFMEVAEEEKALKMIDAGEMHIWLWDIGTKEGREFAEKSPNIELIPAYAGMYDFFLNPIDTRETTGEFNPFCLREVREALNYYINREFIVKEIMGGFGVPQWTVYPPMFPDYVRNYVEMKQLEDKYAYNPDLAKDIIFNALRKAGCECIGGKWYYEGKPVVIRFFIRTEDVRKQIGDYFASELEKLGFTVERIYGPAIKAWKMVYAGDPRRGEWHIYTEGWAFGAISAYDDESPYYMYCSPWTGTVFEYYKPAPELEELATKLLKCEYKSLEERNEWVVKLTKLCLEDSTRIWVVLEKTPFPRHKDFVNVAYDLIAGAWSLFTLRTAKFAGKIGGEAKVGNRIMFVSAYNPIGGEKWLYDILVTQYVWDPGVYPHPHTGLYIPVRAKFEVKTAGPDGKLPVPEDALIFDPKTRSWRKVGPGINATSAVTFTFIMGQWHHGINITIADIMFGIAHTLRLCYPEDPIYDQYAVTPSVELFNATFKGIKILEPNKVTIYIDYWHADPTFIASRASVWPVLPWEVLAIMDAAVENRELAFSDSMAETWGVEWLDLTKGPSIPILEKYYKELAAKNYIPPEIAEWVTPDEAKARWDAVGKFYAEYGHFYISNGPFIIEKVDPAAKMLVLKANRNYPFKADHWDFLVTPKVPSVEVVEKPERVVPGLPATIKLSVTVKGLPYSKVSLKALLISPEGIVVLEKVPKMVKPGEFVIELSGEETARLMPGIYTIVLVAVGYEAALPMVVSTSLTVIPTTVYMAEELSKTAEEMSKKLEATSKDIAEAIKGLSKAIADELRGVKTSLEGTIKGAQTSLADSIGDVRAGVDELSDAISDLAGALSTVTTLLIVAIVLLIVDIATTVVVGRKR